MPLQMVTIEGNVGAGKSTIALHISKSMPDCKYMPAPTRDANPYWKPFQADPKGNALAMQRWFLKERLRVYVKALEHMQSTGESVILDFSIWSDLIFAVHHHDQQLMTTDELGEYMSAYKAIESLGLPPPHLTIVLHANPSVCLERFEASGSLHSPQSRTPRQWSKDEASAYLEQINTLLKQRWLRDIDSVVTPKWIAAERVPADAPGIPAAPSKEVLVRDWSDLSKVSVKVNTSSASLPHPNLSVLHAEYKIHVLTFGSVFQVLVDAIFCTNPSDFRSWLAPFLENADRVRALIQQLSDTDETEPVVPKGPQAPATWC